MYVSGLNPLTWFGGGSKPMATPKGIVGIEQVLRPEQLNLRPIVDVSKGVQLLQTKFNTATGKINIVKPTIAPTYVGGQSLFTTPTPIKLAPVGTIAKPQGISAPVSFTPPTSVQQLTTTPTPAASTATPSPQPQNASREKLSLNTLIGGGLAVAAALFMPRGNSGGSAPSAGSAYAPTTSQTGSATAPAVATPGTVAPPGGAYVLNPDGSLSYVNAGQAINPGSSYVPAEQYTQAAAQEALTAGGIPIWLIAAAIGGVALVAMVPKKNKNASRRAYRRTPAARSRARRYA